ncbi:MAG: hypothetical protein ACR2H1_13055 [Limisphaerales bacterium]
MKRRTLIGLVLIFALLCGVVWQYKAIQDSKNETAKLRAELKDQESLRNKNQRLPQNQIDAAELERLRKQQSELLQLRGEAGRLRRQLAETAAKQKQLAREIPELPVEQESPVEIFQSKVRATVGVNQVLVLGGWSTKPGRRTLIFVTPRVGGTDSPSSISIDTTMVEMPENISTTLGLGNDILSGAKESAGGFVFNKDDFLRVVQTDDIEILSTPQVTTANGRQAEVSVQTSKKINKVDYQLGPSVNLVPTISSDGSSIDLSVIARLVQENQPKK